MTTWEIRLANQDPVRVEVEDTRNLVQEFLAASARRHWWHRSGAYWVITEHAVLHTNIVAGVFVRHPKFKAGRLIGFGEGEHEGVDGMDRGRPSGPGGSAGVAG